MCQSISDRLGSFNVVDVHSFRNAKTVATPFLEEINVSDLIVYQHLVCE